MRHNIPIIQYCILCVGFCILYICVHWKTAPHRWARPAHRVRWHHESIPLTVNSFYLQMWTKLCLNILFYCTSEVFTLFVAICLHSYMYWFYLFVYAWEDSQSHWLQFFDFCGFRVWLSWPFKTFFHFVFPNVYSKCQCLRMHNHSGCILDAIASPSSYPCQWVA